MLRTAIGLAEARAAAGQPTVLADADFDDPRMHQFLDVPNLEGLADVFEFGASPGRVMVRPDTRNFDFLPAGPYVPDPASILRSPRWDRLAEEVGDDGALLLVFAPADAPGLDALSARAGAAILVGDPRGVDRAEGALDPSCAVVAVVEPESPLAPARLSAQAGVAGEMDATIFDDPVLMEPVVFRSDKRRRQLGPLLWILLVAAVAVGSWFVYQWYVATPTEPPVVQPEPDASAAPPEPVPQPVETPIGFSVAVEAHQDQAAAEDRLARLRRAAPDLSFYMAPVDVGGSVWYRVLAGPVTDRETGIALMRELVDANLKTALDDWAVRPTTYAFLLGELETMGAAQARVTELAERGIPAYVVPIRYEPGGTRYRVYGGAFENEAAAAVMQEMLDDAGIDARLIERVGEPLEVTE
jgi:cell division septation protein DedD